MESFTEWVGSETLAWALLVLLGAIVLVAVALWLTLARRRREVEAPARRGLDLQLARTREGLLGRIRSGLVGSSGAEMYERLEEILVTSDFGIDTTEYLLKKLRERDPPAEKVEETLRETILHLFQETQRPFAPAEKPTVVMVVGVNGVGKTTSIGKIAARYAADGKTTLLAAGDTFRAAAIEQLAVWAERSGSELVKGQPEGDPAAVCFDAVKAGQARGVDIVLCDTAGRLHTKSNLMDELKKVKRVMAKALPSAPHEVWLVVDATTGQNAVSQARLFHEAVGLTGLVMTKLDGTAKGGTLVGIVRELRVPVRFIGVGEGIDDLQPFEATAYVNAILGEP